MVLFTAIWIHKYVYCKYTFFSTFYLKITMSSSEYTYINIWTGDRRPFYVRLWNIGNNSNQRYITTKRYRGQVFLFFHLIFRIRLEFDWIRTPLSRNTGKPFFAQSVPKCPGSLWTHFFFIQRVIRKKKDLSGMGSLRIFWVKNKTTLGCVHPPSHDLEG